MLSTVRCVPSHSAFCLPPPPSASSGRRRRQARSTPPLRVTSPLPTSPRDALASSPHRARCFFPPHPPARAPGAGPPQAALASPHIPSASQPRDRHPRRAALAPRPHHLPTPNLQPGPHGPSLPLPRCARPRRQAKRRIPFLFHLSVHFCKSTCLLFTCSTSGKMLSEAIVFITSSMMLPAHNLIDISAISGFPLCPTSISSLIPIARTSFKFPASGHM
ncbi:hypothetical protein DAI22_04g022800 [Oryza sativa Japonica Group]|nr:hypothetical protein DAI22_04g022800 [Oryza sativa Japonica Group]